MTPLRTNIAVFAAALSGVVFFILLAARVDGDIFALACVAPFVVASFFDIRLLFIGWFVLSPWFYPMGTEEGANIASNITHNIAPPMIAVVTLALFFLKGRRLIFGKEDLVLLAFVGYTMLSSYIATNGRYTDIRMFYLSYLVPWFLYLIVKNIDIDARLFRWLGLAAIFHLVVVVLLAGYQYSTGVTLYTQALTWKDVGMGRIDPPFGSPIILGIFATMLFSFVYIAYRSGVLPRYVLWISGLVSAGIIILTFTRSVWLGAFVTIIYTVYKLSENVGAKFLRVAGVVAIAVLLVGVMLAASADIEQRVTGEANANFRVVMGQASVNMILDKPLIGWGAGTFDDVSDRYLFDALGVYIVKDTSHVTLLTLLAELGIVGTALFLIFIYSNLRFKGITMADMPFDDQIIVVLSIGGVIMFAINAFLIDMRFYSLSYSWFFVNLGFIHNIYRGNLSARDEAL